MMDASQVDASHLLATGSLTVEPGVVEMITRSGDTKATEEKTPVTWKLPTKREVLEILRTSSKHEYAECNTNRFHIEDLSSKMVANKALHSDVLNYSLAKK